MTDFHHARLSRLRTTSELLRETTSSFASQPLTFFFLIFLLFSFHSVVDHCSILTISFVYRDPSLRSILSRLPQSDAPHFTSTRIHHHLLPPFLTLTRIGTLDDDFFSTNEHDPQSRSLFNATTAILSGFDGISGMSRPIADNGLNLPQIIRTGFVLGQFSSEDDDETKSDESELDRKTEEHRDEMKLVFMGMELNHRDAAGLFLLVNFLSTAYGWIILGFTIIIYSLVLAIIFVTVINNLAGRFPSFLGVLCSGSKLGFKRVTGFISMRLVGRDALIQLLGLWYFREIKDRYSFFLLFARIKLMPFTVIPPWMASRRRYLISYSPGFYSTRLSV